MIANIFWNVFEKVVSPKNMNMQFLPGDLIIDVSHNNGLIDWHKVAGNNPKVKGAFLKCSEGATNADKKFLLNVEGCRANGIPFGAYHFATWNNPDVIKDGKQEAQFFISNLQKAGKIDLKAVLDIESNKQIPYSRQMMVDYVKAFTDEVIAVGYEPAIYASPGFLNSYLPKDHPFTNIPLWIADYTAPINPVPGWTKIWLHQYTEQGKIDGIITNVDLNRIL